MHNDKHLEESKKKKNKYQPHSEYKLGLKMKFNLFSKLLFVLFTSMLLQNHVHGKPYESYGEDETGKSPSEEKLATNQALQNETSGIRAKREVFKNMTEICPVPARLISTSKNACVKGRYGCFGYAETVCNKYAPFLCDSSVPQHRIPKCIPVYHNNFVMIGKFKVRWTVSCKCA
ncbi:hypothetical protein ACROYT_G002389 [Oculina patagonica]